MGKLRSYSLHAVFSKSLKGKCYRPLFNVLRDSGLNTMHYKFLFLLAVIGLSTPVNAAKLDSDEVLRSLADSYLTTYTNVRAPDLYWSGFDKIDVANRFYRNSAQEEQAFYKKLIKIEAELNDIDVASLGSERSRVFYAKFVESLQALKGIQVCNQRLWDVNHMSGPHITLNMLASRQALKTEQQRGEALKVWQDAVMFYDEELVNLKEGLAKGYSAPKSVVARVIEQHNNLTAPDFATHPFIALTKRTDNQAFKENYKKLLTEELIPAMTRYTAFLEKEYLPKARSSRALSSLPDGRACYMASYRLYTSMQRTPEIVHKLGKQAVDRQKQQVIAFGKASLKVDDFEEIIKHVKEDKSQSFKSGKELHEFYENVVKRAEKIVPNYFYSMPKTKLIVDPVPVHFQGNGFSASYHIGTKAEPAKFRYDPTSFADATYGSAEIVAVHEGFPGHHQQLGLEQNVEPFHRLEKLFFNGAFTEGWGRYSEILAEEIGIIKTDSAKILRRAWPARGMVADTGLHILGWSDEQVTVYLRESGSKYAVDIESLLDRMSVMPAQLTSYDSGALEILTLREDFKKAQGKSYSIKEFHHRLLKNGGVPMSTLREQVLAK